MLRLFWTTLLVSLIGGLPVLAQGQAPAKVEGQEATAAPAIEVVTDVTIFSSRLNQAAMEEAEFDYRRGIKYWANLADRAGLSFRVAGDYELSTGPAKSKLYILHYIERLTPEQRQQLTALANSGASMIVIGMAGSADAEGATHPPSLAEEWFDLKDIRPYTPKESAYFVTLPPSPLALTIDPGRRFEFDWSGRYYLANTLNAAAGNVDWLLRPFPEAPDHAQNAVAAIRTVKGARLAWFGVGPDAVVDESDARPMFDSSVIHLLHWMVRKPVAAICHWPGCARAAAIVTADVEDKFETGDTIALACHKENVRGSFFLVGKLAPDYPEVVAALAENGEIGTHSMQHGSFKERGYKEQLQELEEGKAGLEKIGITDVMGFRPPMEEYDYDTIHAVAHADLKFIYGNLDYDRAFPIVRDIDGKYIYQFARIVADDYNLVFERGVTSSAEYQREYFKEFQFIQRLGGVFPFSFHTNYLALQESVDVVRAMIVRLRQEKAWITTFGEVIDWLYAREQISVTTTSEGSMIVISVQNKSEATIAKLPVRVFPHRDQVQLVPVATPSRGLTVGPTGPNGAIIQIDVNPGETKVIKLR